MKAFDSSAQVVPFEVPPDVKHVLVLPASGDVRYGKRGLQEIAVLTFKDSESPVTFEIHLPVDIAAGIGAEMQKKKLIVVGRD